MAATGLAQVVANAIVSSVGNSPAVTPVVSVPAVSSPALAFKNKHKSRKWVYYSLYMIIFCEPIGYLDNGVSMVFWPNTLYLAWVRCALYWLS